MSDHVKSLTVRIVIATFVAVLLLLYFREQVVWALMALNELAPALILFWFWKARKR